MFGITLPKPREVQPGAKRRTYLVALFPFAATLILVLMFGGLARDLAPILVDHVRFWTRETRRLCRAMACLWRA